MIIATTEQVAGYDITDHLGIVVGNTIRAKNIGRDLKAVLRTVVGGEIKEYTSLMAEAREQALMRLKEKAEVLGADAVIGLRFQTSMVMAGASELLVYGNAVKLQKK
ncbi:MAG: YbjQ family protein [Fidelibacterota bacterium]